MHIPGTCSSFVSSSTPSPILASLNKSIVQTSTDKTQLSRRDGSKEGMGNSLRDIASAAGEKEPHLKGEKDASWRRSVPYNYKLIGDDSCTQQCPLLTQDSARLGVTGIDPSTAGADSESGVVCSLAKIEQRRHKHVLRGIYWWTLVPALSSSLLLLCNGIVKNHLL